MCQCRRICELKWGSWILDKEYLARIKVSSSSWIIDSPLIFSLSYLYFHFRLSFTNYLYLNINQIDCIRIFIVFSFKNISIQSQRNPQQTHKEKAGGRAITADFLTVPSKKKKRCHCAMCISKPLGSYHPGKRLILNMPPMANYAITLHPRSSHSLEGQRQKPK